MSKAKRAATTVTKTAKGLKRRDEELTRASVREAEMAGLADLHGITDRPHWDVGSGNARGSKRN